MIRVRCILVETTVPVRIRPRMETMPVKGHFLSVMQKNRISVFVRLETAVKMSIGLFQPVVPWNNEHRDQGALLTDVGAFNGSLGCSEAQSNIFVPSSSTLADSSALCSLDLVVEEDVRLLLVGALGLHGQLGRHDCWLGW